MNQRHVISAALASVLALGLAAPASAAAEKEACYGIAKAGQNDCQNLSGSHACAGQSKMDHDIADWKNVAKGACKEMKGYTKAEAQAMMKPSKS